MSEIAVKARRITKTIVLEGVVEYGDELITEIEIQRCTFAELQTFLEAINAPEPKEGEPLLPAVQPLGLVMPAEKWAAIEPYLLADDIEKIQDAVNDFTPRRLKVAAEQASPSGVATSVS